MGTDSSSHDVQDVCRRVRPRVQLAVLHPRLDDGVHSLLLAAPELGAREVQVGYDHHRPGHLHRCVPLHPHLQLVGRCLRVPRSRCRWPSRRPDTYRQALQRRVPLHGLAADCAAPAHRDHLLLQLDSGSGRLEGVGARRLVGSHDCPGPPPWCPSCMSCTRSSSASRRPSRPRATRRSRRCSRRSATPLSSRGAPTPWSTSSRCSASMTPRPSSPSSWDTASPTSSPSAASASSSTTSPSPSRPRSTTRSSASRVLHPGGHNWRGSLLGRVSLRRCTGLLSFV